MRLCNANFVTDGPVVAINRSPKKHLFGNKHGGRTLGSVDAPDQNKPNDKWWHSIFEPGLYNATFPLPVCWRKNKPLALWFGRDGWCAETSDTCRKAAAVYGWMRVFDKTAHDGFTFATTDSAANEPGGPNQQYDLSLSEALEEHRAYTYIRIGGEYVLLWGTQDDDDEYYLTWENYSPQNPEHPRPDGPTWCGHNTQALDSFVIFDNTRPPDPASADQVHYRVGVRCTRLLLVKNASFKTDDTIDFSNATIREVEHGSDGYSGNNKITGPNRLNSERPLFYNRGAGRERGIQLYDEEEFHFPPVDNAADPWTDDVEAAYPSPVYVPVTTRDGIEFPQSKYGVVDFPNKWPAYTYRSGRIDDGPNQGDGKVRARYWDAHSNPVDYPIVGNAGDIQQPIKALEEDVELVKNFYEFNPSNGKMERPVAAGTAFDMVLAVRTKHWRRYKAVISHYNGKRGEDCIKGKWVYDTHGYFNSEIAGWIYQLAPTKPKGA